MHKNRISNCEIIHKIHENHLQFVCEYSIMMVSCMFVFSESNIQSTFIILLRRFLWKY